MQSKRNSRMTDITRSRASQAGDKPVPTFDWADVDKAREQYAGSQDTPAHGFTIQAYAEKYGLPYTTAAGQLAEMAKQGKMKAGKRMGFDIDGRRRPLKVYWLV
jgi:hypothetical protein